MKFILVTGGVISGVGKGHIAGALAACLLDKGIPSTICKIDPYMNRDASEFSATEHGAVNISDEGQYNDMDNYTYNEMIQLIYNYRFKLESCSNINSYKILRDVQEDNSRETKEMSGFVEAVKRRLLVLSHLPTLFFKSKAIRPEVIIIELGGDVEGIDAIPYLNALRELGCKHEYFHVHTTLLLKHFGEIKTRPAQRSIYSAKKWLYPDIVYARVDGEGERSAEKLGANVRVLPYYKNRMDIIPDVALDIDLIIEKFKFKKMKKPYGLVGLVRDITETKGKRDFKVSIVSKCMENCFFFIQGLRHAAYCSSVNLYIEQVSPGCRVVDTNLIVYDDTNDKFDDYCLEGNCKAIGLRTGFNLISNYNVKDVKMRTFKCEGLLHKIYQRPTMTELFYNDYSSPLLSIGVDRFFINFMPEFNSSYLKPNPVFLYLIE